MTRLCSVPPGSGPGCQLIRPLGLILMAAPKLNRIAKAFPLTRSPLFASLNPDVPWLPDLVARRQMLSGCSQHFPDLSSRACVCQTSMIIHILQSLLKAVCQCRRLFSQPAEHRHIATRERPSRRDYGLGPARWLAYLYLELSSASQPVGRRLSSGRGCVIVGLRIARQHVPVHVSEDLFDRLR